MVSTEGQGNALGIHFDGESLSHISSLLAPICQRNTVKPLFSARWRQQPIYGQWGGGKRTERVGRFPVHFGRERAIAIMHYFNVQE